MFIYSWGDFFKTELRKRIALICFIEITSILAHAKTKLNQAVKPYLFEFSWFLCKNTQQSILNWNWYPENLNKPVHKILKRSSTCMWSHANIKKYENDNWFSEQFRQKLSSQNTRNGTSEHQDLKFLQKSCPFNPLCSLLLWHLWDSSAIEKYSSFTYSEGWTVCN